MNASASSKLLLVICIGLLCTESLRAQWPTDFQNVGQSYLELSGKIFDRPGDEFEQPIIFDGITESIILSSGDVTDLNGGGGAEARFGSTGPRCQKWEVRTFMATWDNFYFFDQENMQSPLIPPINDMGTIFSPDEIEVGYDSEIFSVEFSIRRPWTNGITFICGPRYMRLNEELIFTTHSLIDTAPFPGPFILDTENEFETTNNLLGMQIGALFNFPVSRDIYLNGFIRTGAYANWMELNVFADTTLSDPIFQEFDRSTSSFVAEVGGKLFYDLIPGCLAGFAGYEATWIDQVALAPAQATTLEPDGIYSRTTPFFHAILFGLQFRR